MTMEILITLLLAALLGYWGAGYFLHAGRMA